MALENQRLEKLKARDRALNGAVRQLSADLRALHARQALVKDRLAQGFAQWEAYETTDDFFRNSAEAQRIAAELPAIAAELAAAQARWEPVSQLVAACERHVNDLHAAARRAAFEKNPNPTKKVTWSPPYQESDATTLK